MSGVEINTGPVACGQWISRWASRICYALARLASIILKSYSSLHGLVLIVATKKYHYKYFNYKTDILIDALATNTT